MILYSNGQYHSSEESLFTYDNRGFQFGDGVFETMIYKNGSVTFFDDHMIRFRKALASMELNNDLCGEDVSILNIIQELKSKNNFGASLRIKLIVHRASGGLYSPIATEGILTVIVSEHSPSTVLIKEYVVFSDDIRNHYHKASAFKLLSSGRYVMAGLEMRRRKADDIIIMDIDGNLSECLQANLFWIRNNEVYTPSIETGCIEGIVRKQLKQYCEEHNIRFHANFYPLVQLELAEVVFAANIAGITAFKKIEAVSFKTEHPLMDAFRNLL